MEVKYEKWKIHQIIVPLIWVHFLPFSLVFLDFRVIFLVFVSFLRTKQLHQPTSFGWIKSMKFDHNKEIYLSDQDFEIIMLTFFSNFARCRRNKATRLCSRSTTFWKIRYWKQSLLSSSSFHFYGDFFFWFGPIFLCATGWSWLKFVMRKIIRPLLMDSQSSLIFCMTSFWHQSIW